MALVISPGGDRGPRVSVTLSAADKPSRGAVEAALGAYLFASNIDIGG